MALAAAVRTNVRLVAPPCLPAMCQGAPTSGEYWWLQRDPSHTQWRPQLRPNSRLHGKPGHILSCMVADPSYGHIVWGSCKALTEEIQMRTRPGTKYDNLDPWRDAGPLRFLRTAQ